MKAWFEQANVFRSVIYRRLSQNISKKNLGLEGYYTPKTKFSKSINFITREDRV